MRKQEKVNQSASAGLIIAFCVSILFTFILIIFKDKVQTLFKTQSIGIMVFSLIPALVFSSIYSILRGALWGKQKFFMISFLELFEELIRIISLVIMLMLPFLSIKKGVIATFSLSIACIFSSILAIIMYYKSGNKIVKPNKELLPIFKESSAITTARTASSIVQMLISFIIPLRLVTFGFSSSQAMAEFGIVTGMALPLLTIPGTFISSIAVALVPEISSKTSNIDKIANETDKKFLQSKISLALNCTLIIAFMFVPAFLTLGTPIAEIVFKNSRAGTYLSAGSFLMICMGITQITSSILNSIGLELKALKNYCYGAVGLLFGIYFLPRYMGAMSLIVAMLSLQIISGYLGLKMLKKRDLLKANLSQNLIKLIIITIISSIITSSVYKLLYLFLPKLIACAFSAMLSLVIFFSLCYALNITTVKIFVSRKLKKRKAHI